ncbi:MAG: hypothetical protein D6729_01800 [Deltaproteobacteria bacterium]|nr:MAG: hypothetical protein D6729_01800 [Deltaproteobacteria bacterium]
MRPLPGMRTVAALSSLGLLAGCAGAPVSAHPAGPIRRITLPPVEIEAGGPGALELADLNAEELWSVAVAAYAAGDYEKAGRAFRRIAEIFPESPRASEAAYNAGLAFERMGEYLWALDAYEPLLDRFEGKDRRDVAFRAAEALYHLEDFGRAARLLAQISKDETVTMPERIEALVKEGVCLLELGEDRQAEARLRRAVGRYHIERRRSEEAVDTYYPAQGQFFLGEVYRLRFERARLDPASVDLDALADDLEHKAELLLSAQGHYLRAIRMGEPRWATAAGFQIGRLYETFFDEMVHASLPPGLEGASERLAYRALLAERVRVLLDKAMTAYERTLATAERTGVKGAWRTRVEASLERVKAFLRKAVQPAPSPSEPKS